MIRIDAIIKPERVNVVLQAMSEAGCTGFTYSNVTGRGNQDGVEAVSYTHLTLPTTPYV